MRRRLPLPFVSFVLIALLSWGALAPGAPAGEDVSAAVEERLDAARVHLAQGRAEEAWAEALVAAELDPERVDVLEAVSEIAEKGKRADDALWMAHRAVVVARRDGWKAKDLRPLLRRVVKLDPLPPHACPDLALHAKRYYDLGAAFARRGLYANAVELLRRCRGTEIEEKAEKALERLYEKEEAVEALVASGLDVPIVDKDSRLARRMTQKDPEHAAWADPWVLESTNYRVRTNLPWLLGRQISAAMEQMQRYYVGFFLDQAEGTTTRRCDVDVYRTWEEYSANEPYGADALGFFVPGKNRIVTYDQRCEGGAFEDVWEVLFHEASHQFMHTICTRVPAWLDEGTASYFEGARLRPTGRVETNYVAEHRLQNLVSVLDDRSPTLEQTIRYPGPGSYPAEFYCVGWGIVYFLKNYEDDKCERVYEDLYEKIVDSYAGGEEHDFYDRFVDTFVKRANQPGIASFRDWEMHWEAWIRDLHVVTFGGAEMAERHLETARRRMRHGKEEAAHESYRWALQKRPDHPACLYEIATLGEKRGEEDVALFRYRELARHLESVANPQAVPDGLGDLTNETLLARCRERIAALAPGLAEQEGAVRGEFVAHTKRAADRYVEGGFPRSALYVLRAAERVLGGDEALAEHARLLGDRTEVDARTWRRVPALPGLDAWFLSGEWQALEGMLSVSEKKRAAAYPRAGTPSGSFRMEATIRMRPFTSRGGAGLVFGDDGRGVRDVFALVSGGRLERLRVVGDLVRRDGLGEIGGEADRWVRLAVEIDGTRARFYADGRLVGEHVYTRDDLEGQAGLFVEAALTDVKDFRIGG